MTEPITLTDLLRAGKRRWGNEHLVVAECFDGIATHLMLFAERGDLTSVRRELVVVAEGYNRGELLREIETAPVENPAQAAPGDVESKI